MKKLTLAIVLLFCGCTARIVDFTAISTKNMNFSRVYKSTERVVGIDKMRVVVFVPTSAGIDIKEAIDNAIEKTPGCVGLADGVIYQTSWYVPLIYGENYYTIEGTPLLER